MCVSVECGFLLGWCCLAVFDCLQFVNNDFLLKENLVILFIVIYKCLLVWGDIVLKVWRVEVPVYEEGCD